MYNAYGLTSDWQAQFVLIFFNRLFSVLLTILEFFNP